jgi:hypothetical protein
MKRRTGEAAGRGESGPGSLEIEFENEEGDGDAREGAQRWGGEQEPPAPDPRRFKRRAVGAAAVIGVAALVAALTARNGTGSNSSAPDSFSDDNSTAVQMTYVSSALVSVPQRRLDVTVTVTPVQPQALEITQISVSEAGVTVTPVGSPSTVVVPATGRKIVLLLTVTDCSRVPMDESMAYVDVVTRQQNGDLMDRFTILGDSYSADISRLLHRVCGTAATPGPATPRATGPLGTVS